MFFDQSERAPGPIYIIKAVKRTRIFYEYTRVVKDKSNIIFQTFREFRQNFQQTWPSKRAQALRLVVKLRWVYPVVSENNKVKSIH